MLTTADDDELRLTTNAQPVLTSVLSWIVFGERFGLAFFLGAALILFGVSWVETRRNGAARIGEPAKFPRAPV